MTPVATPAELRTMLRYDPETGKLYWISKGIEAFTNFDNNGYRQGCINGRTIRAHRVIWAIVHGEWPDRQIDHKNGNKSDNSILNLRLATPAQNNFNKKIRSDNTSGYKGVSWIKKKNLWHARINCNGKMHYLGKFKKLEDAARAYTEAAKKFFGEFVRLS